MNKRIEQLVEQCGFRSNPDVYDRNQSFDIEKFAELIVRECADLRTEIELVGLHSEDYEQGVWEGLQMYQNQIKRHFGVEE